MYIFIIAFIFFNRTDISVYSIFFRYSFKNRTYFYLAHIVEHLRNKYDYSFEIKFEQKHLVNPYFTINKKNPF